MPSRMIHYLIAEKVAEQIKIENMNRFKLGSLCPDMSCREDFSKNRTHYLEVHGDKKGGNWMTFVSRYVDFHRLNYILRNEFGLVYNLEEDRNLELEGLYPKLYDEVVQGLYQDFFDDPEAKKDDLEVYTYDISLECIRLCIKECVNAITAFRKGEELIHPEKYYVPTY